MGKYSISNDMGGTKQAIAAAYKTLLSIFTVTGALRRGRLIEVIIGCDGTPANNAVTVEIARMTADGTGTAVTPTPLDPADPAALLSAKANYTAEPTAATIVATIAMNQQATVRWVPTEEERLMFAATNLNGLVIRAKSASYTGTMIATAVFEE